MPLVLPLVHYRLVVRVNRPWRLPEYAGSMLRGIYGHALKEVACRCSNNRHKPSCQYALLFELPSGLRGEPVQPYVITPPVQPETPLEAGEMFEFGFLLAGAASWLADVCILAWNRALAEWFGQGDGHASLEAVIQQLPEGDVPVWWRGETEMLPHANVWVLPDIECDAASCRLVFDTPLRIHRNGQPVKAEELSAYSLCIGLLRRMQSLFGTEVLPPDVVEALVMSAPRLQMTENALAWRDFSRYSNRQERRIALGGLVGSIEIAGDLQAWMPLLLAGQVLHLGKNTTMGFGHYVLA